MKSQRVTQLCLALAFIAQGMRPREVLTLTDLREYLDGEDVTEKFFRDVDRIVEAAKLSWGLKRTFPMKDEMVKHQMTGPEE